MLISCILRCSCPGSISCWSKRPQHSEKKRRNVAMSWESFEMVSLNEKRWAQLMTASAWLHFCHLFHLCDNLILLLLLLWKISTQKYVHRIKDKLMRKWKWKEKWKFVEGTCTSQLLLSLWPMISAPFIISEVPKCFSLTFCNTGSSCSKKSNNVYNDFYSNINVYVNLNNFFFSYAKFVFKKQLLPH